MNYWKKFAEMIGVVYETEEFKLLYNESYTFCVITFKGITHIHDVNLDLKSNENEFWLKKILDGTAQVIKLPWRPDIDDMFYVPAFDSSKYERFYYNNFDWQNKLIDAGLVKKTEEEAKALTDKILKNILETSLYKYS